MREKKDRGTDIFREREKQHQENKIEKETVKEREGVKLGWHFLG